MADEDDFESPPTPPSDREDVVQGESRRQSHVDEEDEQSEVVAYSDDEEDEQEENDDNEDDYQRDNDEDDTTPRSKKSSAMEEDDDDDDDEDLNISQQTSKKKKSKRAGKDKSKKQPKRKRSSVARFFADQAEVADESESDGDDYVTERGVEEIQSKDIQEAVQRVERRHDITRERLNRSAEELAREYEERARDEMRYTQKSFTSRYADGQDDVASMPSRHLSSVVANKQALLPSNRDPFIWRVKCTPGREVSLVRSLMYKEVEHKLKTGITRIKSAFASSTKGMIYIEAFAEPFAKESVQGLYGIYSSSFARIPIEEMTSLFHIVFKKKPLAIGQFVRLKRGILKGDLAQIVELLDGGVKAIIKAMPRPDYNGAYAKGAGGIRPPQKSFDPADARAASGIFPERQRFGSNREMYDFFSGDYYRDGFLFKEVNVATYIQSDNVNPKIEELQLLLAKGSGAIDDSTSPPETKSKGKKVRISNDRNEDDDDSPRLSDEEDDEDGRSIKRRKSDSSSSPDSIAEDPFNSNILLEIAKQSAKQNVEGLDDSSLTETVPYVIGDLVQVTQGELKNLVGKVLTVNHVTKIVRIQPKNSSYRSEVDVEVGILVKYITPGSHVKVVSGPYNGQTGRVVAVNIMDGDHVAAILTDSTNSEITCNLSHLQISDEVTTGLSSLNGYELYDLVAINDNETAVVIQVGLEKLKVLNNLDDTKDVFPQELQGKRNTQSQRSSMLDSNQNAMHVGDTVNVISGKYSNRSGTIKHIMKGILWLHSNSYLKNSGIFVTSARSCVIAGATNKISAGLKDLQAAHGNSQRPTVSNSRPPPGKSAPGHGRGGKHPDIGKTVRILKGGFKGLLGTVVNVTNTHYSLELLARMKKIIIEKESTVIAGTKDGSLTVRNDAVGEMMSSATPYIGASDTPAYHGMGSQTPRMFGSETPSFGSETPGSRTPSYQTNDSDSIWKLGAFDSMATPATTPGNAQGWGNSNSNFSDNTGISNNASGWGARPGGLNQSAYDSRNQNLSIYSPLNGGNSNYTPTSAGFSPAGTIGLNTPASLNSMSMNSTKPSNNSNANNTSSEWEAGFVVSIQKGDHAGSQGVIDHKPDKNGSMYVRLREAHGGLRSNRVTVNSSDTVLATPPIGVQVVVFTGKHKGLKGIVESIDGKDVLININSDKREYIRLNQVAWIYAS